MIPGTLTLVSTPIGNLEDITYRAVRTLREADLIAAEDTRNTLKLLNHFDIHTPMTSYHEHNKLTKAETLLARLREGARIALVTDAGTPGISDPGEELVRLCIAEGISVTAAPGPAAFVTAAVISGQPVRRLAFEAFLPKNKKERARVLTELSRETRTIVLYEAPHHLCTTLAALYDALGDRPLSVTRELTKKHEEVFSTTLSGAIAHYEVHEPRGEYVLVIRGREKEAEAEEERKQWERMTVEAHVAYYEAKGQERKEAMKSVARDRGIPKREVYRALLTEDE